MHCLYDKTNDKMKFALVCVVFAVLAVALGRPDDGQYTTKFDNVDLDEILTNKRLLKNYANCLLQKGNCTPDAAELKRVLPEAISTECAKCNEKQKKGSAKVIKYLIEKEPELWTEFEKMYDPNGEYKIKYCKRAKEEKIDTMGKCDD